jgi:DNA polymerase I-like protein with 3'-5' exonuclease and polymerase domains
MGQWHYLRDPRGEIYMVSIVGEGLEPYCGPVDAAPWAQIDGWRWVAHNYSFDGQCVEALGDRVRARPSEFFCTANLAAFMGSPRDLEGASHHLLQKEISKDPRKKMKGQRWADVQNTEFACEMQKYALDDSHSCLELYDRYASQMPEIEKELSRHTVKMAWKGFSVNKELVEQGIRTLGKVKWEAEQKLPWLEEGNGVVLSVKNFRAECVKAGIPYPESLSEDSEECAVWEQTYGEKVPWVAAMRDWRKANSYLVKMKVLRSRIRPDGTVAYGLKYFGAHTGRFSGDSRLNVQNLPREAYQGVDLRSCIVPRPGKKFIICDLSQIEPRVLAWLSGNYGLLNAVREGYAIYEAFAISAGLWTGEKGTLKKTKPKLYHLAKAMVLGLGYGAGAKKFSYLARTSYGLDMDETEAARVVTMYRSKNPKVVAFWRKLETAFKQSMKCEGYTVSNGCYEIQLPSWRSLWYRNIRSQNIGREKPGYTAQVVMGAPHMNFYGGILCNNTVQATARDVMAECILRLEKAGLPLVLHVHDEAVVEVDRDVSPRDVEQIMSVTPEWLEGCPVAAEASETQHYIK